VLGPGKTRDLQRKDSLVETQWEKRVGRIIKRGERAGSVSRKRAPQRTYNEEE